MKIELTGYELEDAISQYLAKMFKQPIEEVTIPDDQCVECYITLGSDKVDEDEPEIIETKVKRTRKKPEPKPEPEGTHDVRVPTELDEEVSTHYSKLPTLDSEEHSTYIELLKLLASNPRNKNRKNIQSLYDNASDNLRTVIEANSAYQDWVKLCKKEDSESPELKLLREVNEEVDEEETKESEKPEEVVNTTEPIVETTPEPEVISAPTHKPLFAFNNSVNKSGSLFPSNK